MQTEGTEKDAIAERIRQEINEFKASWPLTVFLGFCLHVSRN